MAAGRGSRMAPLTDAIPKPMAPYNGSTLIGRGIRELRKSVANIHITIGYKKAVLAPHVIELGVATIINTEDKPNSWWIYSSLFSHFDEPIFVLTCDNIVDLDVAALTADYISIGSPACMLIPVVPVPGLEGDYIHHRDQVVYKVDRHDPAEHYCSGIQILNPGKIARLTKEGESFYDVWRQLIELKELKAGTVKPLRWFSVDTLDQLIKANEKAAEDSKQ